ncbi:MAG: hypothetical protein AABW48_05145 [Nanoarchaeota archaeon]
MNLKRGLDKDRTRYFSTTLNPKFKPAFGVNIGFSKNCNKKGQITIFIIIGILIVFAFAGFLYITKTVSKEALTAEGEPIIASVPQTFKPIQEYTENCLNQIGERGLLLLGQQGGYIYPDVVGKYSAADPTEADGIDLEPLKVPYWHYNSVSNSENDISYSSLQPKLYAKEDQEMSIEAQLSRFAEENLNNCIENYNAFANQGFEIKAPALEEDSSETKEITVLVGDQTVNFWLKMDVEATKGDASVEMNQFFIKIPLRLKHYYEVASEIAKVQKEHNFLELEALDLISAYSAVDMNQLPPTEAVTFTMVPEARWVETDVKEKVKGLLTSYVPMLRYLSSTNFYRHDYRAASTSAATVSMSNLFQKNYDNTILPLETAKGLEVNFDYFGWEPYFDMNDKGGQIEASSYPIHWNILHFNTNHYFSTYDVSYPVLITLNDPAALLGKGYQFIFALESNIRNNQIAVQGYKQPPPSTAERVSMVCDKNKRNTGFIKTIVVDSASLEPLEAVQIGFSVPEQDDCILGETDSGGIFESKYPAVYGGVAGFFKEEYLTNFYPIDTYQYKETAGAGSGAGSSTGSSGTETVGIIGYAVAGLTEKVIPLHKRKMISVAIKKKSLEKCITDTEEEETTCYSQGLLATTDKPVYSYSPEQLEQVHFWTFPNIARPLNEQEKGVIILNRVGDTQPGVFNDEFTATAMVIGNNEAEMELVPGTYKVTALLTSEKSLVIPEDERDDFTMPEQTMDKYLVGQLQWQEKENYLVITPEDLYNSDKITFNILSFNLAGVPQEEHLRVMEDLQVMGKLSELSKTLRSELEPSFG